VEVSVVVTMLTDPFGRVEDDVLVMGGGEGVGGDGVGSSGLLLLLLIVVHEVPNKVSNCVVVTSTDTVMGTCTVATPPNCRRQMMHVRSWKTNIPGDVIITGVGVGIHVLVPVAGVAHIRVVVVIVVGGLVVMDAVEVTKRLSDVITFVLVKVGKVLHDTDIFAKDGHAFQG
jgi:uncharacterized membrane protein YfcA